MNTDYTVTHTAQGHTAERWFSTLEDAKRYARGIVRLGYAPTFRAHTPDNYRAGQTIHPVAFRVWQFFKAVDA